MTVAGRLVTGILVLQLLVVPSAWAVHFQSTLQTARDHKETGKYQEALEGYLRAQRGGVNKQDGYHIHEEVVKYLDGPGTKDRFDYEKCYGFARLQTGMSVCGSRARFLYLLRKEIIDFIRSLGIAPNVPEEAKKLMAQGQAIAENIKAKGDFSRALEKLREAALLAPWLPRVHYNIAVIANKAGKYDEADYALRTYLHAAPGAPDKEKAKELLFLVQARAKEGKQAKSVEPLFK